MKRRNTPSKEAILALLTESSKALSREAIEERIALSMDRATIYRILNRFCDDGIIHRIVAEDGKQYFALCMRCDENSFTDNHFHFHCSQCNSIECLPQAVHFTLPNGYQVENVNCVLVGVCKDCSAKQEKV